MPFATFLLAMMAPLTARVLMALGFSVVTITGMSAVITGLRSSMLTWANQIPAAGLDLAMLAGAGQALGIIMGAIATRLLLWQISNATRILGVNT